MRILVFVERFMYPTQTFVYNEINKLALHHEVKLLTTAHINAATYPFDEVIEIPLHVSAIRRRLFWELESRDILINRRNKKFAEKLGKLIADFKPDVIHGHFGYETITLLENLGQTNIPVFITFHGYDASQMLSRRSYIEKMNVFLKKFNIFPMCVSQYMKEQLLKAGMKVENAEVNYCGVDCDRFALPALREKKLPFVFLQISSFSEKKGHIYTLEAFQLFLSRQENKQAFRLILPGGWDMFESIRKRCADMGLSEYVDFPGPVSPAQAYEYLAKADVFVHHSIESTKGDKEGIPTSIMEAMAMELPVISTWHSGIPELVEDRVNGYLVREKDVEAYAGRMEDILTWPKTSANREKVINQFSLSLHMENLEKFYQEAVQASRK